MSAIKEDLSWHSRISGLNKDVRPVINGRRVEVQSDNLIERVNPATEQEEINISACSTNDVDKAVNVARSTYENVWRDIPIMQRKMTLARLAELIMQHQEELALFDSMEIGKPISAALMEVQIASGFVSYYAEAIDKAYGRTAPTDSDALELQIHRPRGVVAALTPWNFPIINTALKAAPILAAGNTLVLKPSEYSVLSALRLAELAVQAGIPEGVFNVITGAGETGNALVQHDGINMLTFTGSTKTGKGIMQSIGKSHLKPILLECGGNNPQILFKDMMTEDAQGLIMGIVQGAMMNQGQVCVARSRLLVEQSIADEVTDAVSTACTHLQAADPLLAETHFGPLANKMQYDKVSSALNNEKEAELLVDGRKGTFPNKGYYLGPTVYRDENGKSAISQNEVFGPVLTITPFKDENDAIRLANDTEYGLAATVWTKDLARGHRLPSLLNVGWVAVNASSHQSMGAGIAHSHEPYGQSGFGVEGGMAGLQSYTRLQTTSYIY
jgi:gamma-glutamyl-gamma-aminobutyraldehyde dehydrogenase